MPSHEQLQALLPVNQRDTSAAEKLVDLGYPAVAPVLEDLLCWMFSPNDPVVWVLQPFLMEIGAPLIPHLQRLLDAPTDQQQKLWVHEELKFGILTLVVEPLPAHLQQQLRPGLQRLMLQPNPDEAAAGLAQVCKSILYGGD